MEQVAAALSRVEQGFLILCLTGFLNHSGELSVHLLVVVLTLSFLIWVYRCARSVGRSGEVWLVIVIVFKLFGLIALLSIVRQSLAQRDKLISSG